MYTKEMTYRMHMMGQWEYCDIGSRCGVDVPILRQATEGSIATQVKHASRLS
jgi:hypothetical protein